jgi:hypothetical protein
MSVEPSACGGVGERLKPAVLKTVRPQKGLVGSNPTPSATKSRLFSPSILITQIHRFSRQSGGYEAVLSGSLRSHSLEPPYSLLHFSGANGEGHFYWTRSISILGIDPRSSLQVPVCPKPDARKSCSVGIGCQKRLKNGFFLIWPVVYHVAEDFPKCEVGPMPAEQEGLHDPR